MKKVVAILALVLGFLYTNAQNGIKFEHKSFEEVCKMAKQQHKLVFVDVYTQWCGPCLCMVEEVFSLAKVGNIMNDKFVSVKIDAEHGEGKEFARKYGVRSFPTYYFINPKTKKIVHRSGGRHEADEFLKIVENSLTKKQCSSYLTTQYEKGNRKPEFLLDYINYLVLRYDRTNLPKVIDELVNIKGDDLTDKVLGELFLKHITDKSHPLFKKFMAERDKMESIYGKERVEKKIYTAYRWCRDLSVVEAMKDFKGKDYILAYNKLRSFIASKNYEEADKMIMSMLANKSFESEVVMRDVEFIGRRVFYDEADEQWKKMCVKYLQYVAYNKNDRRETNIHFNYAKILEKIIKENPEIHKYFPESVTKEPTLGKKDYSMRSDKLKQKPGHKRRSKKK